MWFTRPQTVAHPSTNRAEFRLTTLIKANALTTSLHYAATRKNSLLFTARCYAQRGYAKVSCLSVTLKYAEQSYVGMENNSTAE